jgi:hypothetical protein
MADIGKPRRTIQVPHRPPFPQVMPETEPATPARPHTRPSPARTAGAAG